MEGSASEVPARQLYGYNVAIWDHTPNTYASAYVAMTAGLVCAGLIWKNWGSWLSIRGDYWALCWQSTLACLFQGVAWGMSGIAFHVIDTHAERGEPVGLNLFGGVNSEWLWPWLLAVALKPLCSACLLGAAITYVGSSADRFTAVQVANAVGACVAFYEAYLVLTAQILESAMPQFYWGIFAIGFAAGIILLMGRGKAGMWWICAGLLVRLVGYLYTAFGPCGALEGYAQDSCPYPQDANKNLFLNVCVALSVVPFYYGIVLKGRSDWGAYQDLSAKDLTKTVPSRGCTSCCGS